MNFLFVGTNPENTGAATHFVALAVAMAEAGHHVEAVVHQDGMIWKQLEPSAVALHAASFRNAFDIRAAAVVWRTARTSSADWLVGNFGKEYWPLIVLGKLLRIKVALFRHRAPAMRRLSAYAIPRLATRFFAVSRNARQAYLDQGIPAGLVRVLYNPVDTRTCRPDASQRHALLSSLGLPDDAIVLGYAGRLQAGKGVRFLLDAATAVMDQAPSLHCVWIGDGPLYIELLERAAHGAHPCRHHFLGWRNDARPWYSAMSMLAFPSLATETFGRVSIEAQAAGVPVLASAIGGVPETLDAGTTGLLLPPRDAAAWQAAILRLCDPALRTTMGTAARAFAVAHFSNAVIAAEFTRQLEEA